MLCWNNFTSKSLAQRYFKRKAPSVRALIICQKILVKIFLSLVNHMGKKEWLIISIDFMETLPNPLPLFPYEYFFNRNGYFQVHVCYCITHLFYSWHASFKVNRFDVSDLYTHSILGMRHLKWTVLMYLIYIHYFGMQLPHLCLPQWAGTDLQGVPSSYFCRNWVPPPPIFAETGLLTVCGRPGTTVFLLKKCLCSPYWKFLDLSLLNFIS